MVKTLNSKISDPRPRINVTLQSDDEKTEAVINKGYVNVQRGHKKAILRLPYGEVQGIIELLQESGKILKENGYEFTGGSEIAANAEPADATEEPAGAPGNADDAGVESVATTGEPAQADADPDFAASADRVDARNEEQQSAGNPFATSAA